MKWGHFDRVNFTFKMLRSSWNFDTVFKKIRSFDAENLGSVCQRAAKLLAVKVGGLKKVCQPAPAPVSQCARVRTPAPSNHSQSLMAGNFAAIWPTDPKFSASKDLIPFTAVSEVQEASSILKVSFDFSKWPHFHKAYQVTIRKQMSIAVCLYVHIDFPCMPLSSHNASLNLKGNKKATRGSPEVSYCSKVIQSLDK